MNFIIHRKVLIFMLFTGLTLLGYISYRHLPMELMPTAELPTLFVQVGSPLSVDPKYMEQQAIIPLEGAITQLDDIKEIESIANQRMGRIEVTYQQGTNMKFAYIKLQEKVDEKAKTLSADFGVQVQKFDIEAINNMFMTLQVRGGGGADRVRKVVDKEIIEKIQNIDGIANAQIFGGREQTVQVLLNEEVCKAHGISPSQVKELLISNSQSRMFAGSVRHNNQSLLVNVFAEYNSLEDIENLIVSKTGPIRLKDVANISFGVKEQSSYSRVNGKESVTIMLIKDSNSNLIKLSETIKSQIDKINEDNDIEIVVELNTADVMKENIDLIIDLAITGGILAICVLWLFLRNFRLVTTVAIAIPVSIFAAYNFFYAFDISINSITLLGIALAVGMLLDNSIVVMENIYRLVSKKEAIDKAAVEGTQEVWRSVFASTLTTVVIFLPFAFSENLFVGLLGKNIGVSVISTLLISLAVSLLLIPMITHFFLKLKKDKTQHHFQKVSSHSRFVQIYLVFLKTCMRSPAATILGALLVFFIVLLTSMGLSAIYQKEPDVEEITLYVTMPQGATLDKTDQVVAEVEKRLESFKEKKELLSQIYEDEAVLTIKLAENYKDFRNLNVAEVKESIRKSLIDIKAAQFSWSPMSKGVRFQGGGGGGGLDIGESFGTLLGLRSTTEHIIIKGQDFYKMYNMAFELKNQLEQEPSIQMVNVNVPSRSPELHLNFDKYLMAMYDISPQSVVSELRSFPSEFSSGATLKRDNEEYEIILKVDSEEEKQKASDRSLDDLKQLKVKNKENAQFEMNQIAKFQYADGLTAINRKNQARHMEINYTFLPDVNQDKELLLASQQAIDNLVENIYLPAGVAIEVVHDDRDFSDFKFLIVAAFLLIYMILASVFESFATPVVLMFTIPLAAIGSLLALILTGTPLLNYLTLIGFIILLGIVVNNSIILIDYTRVLKRSGMSSQRALMSAGMARLRPILVTAITTIIALIPMAMGKSEYISMSGVPFAITVIGGLLVSTLLTLVFIPTFNSGLSDSLNWINSTTPIIKIVMLGITLVGIYLIYNQVEQVVWQIIDFILLIILVPATVFFVQTSLRKANELIIDPKEPIVIRIRNLVKIYDRESRFMREWQSGIKIRERLGIQRKPKSFKDLDQLLWQVPISIFLVYFTYFFVESGFWQFMLPVILHIIILSVLKPAKDLVASSYGKWTKISVIFLYDAFYWLFPIITMAIFYHKHELLGLIIPTSILWYFLLLVKVTSDKLYQDKVNISRIKGRFKGIRKTFFRFVQVIPIIGKKKTPFKALKGVSIDISSGMFGLLGPNGAGKSTLIRIICGLLEPSYGEIKINGIDVKEKREELQGLIGYLPQEFGMYENLTAWDFLDYLAILKKLNNKEQRADRIEYVLKAVHMYDHRDEKIGSFSGGMRQRIGIAQILLHLPRILVVDEPTAGLDPRERIRFRNLLVELSKERVVIFSTHIIEDVASSCNKVAVIKEGELKYLGAPIQMAQSANGKVWVAEMSMEEFEVFKEKYVVIHHIRQGDLIKLRCLAEEAPDPNAKPMNANLEDAYLYLLNQLKVNNKRSYNDDFGNDPEKQPVEVVV